MQNNLTTNQVAVTDGGIHLDFDSCICNNAFGSRGSDFKITHGHKWSQSSSLACIGFTSKDRPTNF